MVDVPWGRGEERRWAVNLRCNTRWPSPRAGACAALGQRTMGAAWSKQEEGKTMAPARGTRRQRRHQVAAAAAHGAGAVRVPLSRTPLPPLTGPRQVTAGRPEPGQATASRDGPPERQADPAFSPSIPLQFHNNSSVYLCLRP